MSDQVFERVCPPRPSYRTRSAGRARVGIVVVALLALGWMSVPAVAGAGGVLAGSSALQAVSVVAQGQPVGAHGFTTRPHAQLTCTFNGSSNAVQGVTPGGTIAVACSGWAPDDTVFAAEVSPLFLSTDSENEIDPNIQQFTTDASGNLSATFLVPNPFTAPDPAAVCPPTAAQQAQYGDCVLALADGSENGGTVGLVYGTSAPPPAAVASTAVGIASTPDGSGYWIAWSNGNVTVHGDARNYGNASAIHLVQPITHIVSTPSGNGYWLVAADGGTFAFGGAGFYGSMGGMPLNKPVVDIAPTLDGKGYWLVAADGGIFSFGDAAFHGSTGSLHLNQPVVGISADTSTGGYWLVASDGGIFAFGDAGFYGSTGNLDLVQPIVGMAATVDGRGYWLVAADGGVFAFGDAGFHGSTGGRPSADPVVGIAATSDGDGYWMVTRAGAVFPFGDATYEGSLRYVDLNAPIVGITPSADGQGYWLAGSDGGVFAFGDAPFYGSVTEPPMPIVGII